MKWTINHKMASMQHTKNVFKKRYPRLTQQCTALHITVSSLVHCCLYITTLLYTIRQYLLCNRPVSLVTLPSLFTIEVRRAGASNSWKPHGLSRPVMGLLYIFTDMRPLTTGIRSEKCVVRRFRRCAKVIDCTYTNVDSIAYCTPRLYGIAYCS